MLLDSNIIIYAAQPDHEDLRRLIASQSPSVSAISVVEVLGYHRLSEVERTHFEEFFGVSKILAVSDLVISEAVRLRQQRKMSLGDALIGATAIANDLTLVTRNVDDFDWIEGLRILNPLASA
ncbi:MAG: type II toxin-antitoxin system VapC family toxin [Acidobacteriota bacterium]